MTVVELDIPMLPPSPNETRGAHWSKAKATRDEAAWAVRAAWLNAGQPHFYRYDHDAPAIVDATVHSSGRPGDSDNAWARLKPIIDAIVKQGLLVDDSPRWLTLGTINHATAPPKKGHVTVRLTYPEESPVPPKTKADVEKKMADHIQDGLPDGSDVTVKVNLSEQTADDILRNGGGVLDVAAAKELARKAELPGMPPRPQLPSQDGLPFPRARIAFNGGIELLLTNQDQIDKAEQFHLEDDVRLVIVGEVSKKQWVVGRDKDDQPIRTLTIGISVLEIPGLADAERQ